MPFVGLDAQGWSVVTFLLSLLAGFYQTIFLVYYGGYGPFRELFIALAAFWITALGLPTWQCLYRQWLQAHELHAVALAAEFDADLDPVPPYTEEGAVDPVLPRREPTPPQELVLVLNDALAEAQALVAEVDLVVNLDLAEFDLL
ncbi:hypothetical protein BKA82DRAFT_4470438 [Pisolithus tinctorius]|nr:hypothetical protein BKA82DRAFT_4470438 [Pisolithus tinctorius]